MSARMCAPGTGDHHDGRMPYEFAPFSLYLWWLPHCNIVLRWCSARREQGMEKMYWERWKRGGGASEAEQTELVTAVEIF